MRLALSKSKVYLGEVITARLEIYFREDVQNFGNFQFTARPPMVSPTANWLKARAPGADRKPDLHGHPLSFALTASKTGPVSVGPVTEAWWSCCPRPIRGGDPFFRQFFNNGEQKQVGWPRKH